MTTPLLATTLVHAEHVRSFHVRTAACHAGWEAAEREDQRVVLRLYTDWHRVEQTLDRFARDIAQLREQGWREA